MSTKGSGVLNFVPSVLPAGESVLRSAADAYSFRLTRKTVLLCVGLFVAVLALLFASLLAGDYRVSLPDLVATFQGHAPNKRTQFFIMDRRLPRALVALLVGAALATAGAIFQSVTRNPLASPDIIGVSSGAAAGASFVLLLVGGSVAQVSLGAFVGALIAAGCIALLAGRNGLHGVKLVLIGVALGALANAAISYMLTQVFVASAVTAQLWLVGSLQGRGWPELTVIAIALMVITPVLWRYSGRLEILRMGDDLAIALGVNVHATRRVLLVFATLLVASAVATAGPISFVALAAPHIARRLSGSGAILPAALIGGLLLATSDLAAQYLFSSPIPVGVVTIVIGGGFFLWLLIREGKQSVH
ncbi:ABC transporter permease [Arthrobacter psychrolactophilus]|uniref:ABC transporter permease n=1 Tax=Arthrobacter psychrolactophilus TaxID=92442 RepID=A0A2V5IQP2_9MICC|nr:iron chelate uptake ABC transporter family permease subunit [Arthrobacter psychrolactophilus]PYI38869.1 ABC transporter permease [Arthrobacter psychrolactophilus]